MRSRAARGGTLVLGGGYVARLLGKAGATIVSPENFMLYTPMLPEAASGTLEPRHVVVPLRLMCPHAELLLGRATALDEDARLVRVVTENEELEINYEHLVVALGAVLRTLPIPGLAEYGLGFKSLADAIHLRNHVLRELEAAAASDEKDRHLTFVFIGAGYAGVFAAQGFRGRDDRGPGDDQTWAAPLELEPVHDVLDRAVVTACVPCLVDVRVEPVLVDQVPGHVPKDRRPAVAEAVRERQRHPVQPGVRLDAVVGERLDLHVAGVGPRANPVALAAVLEERVRAHPTRTLRVVERRVDHRGDGHVVAPSFPGLLVAGEAVDARTAGEAVRETMSVLVEDDPVLEVAVADPRMGPGSSARCPSPAVLP